MSDGKGSNTEAASFVVVSAGALVVAGATAFLLSKLRPPAKPARAAPRQALPTRYSAALPNALVGPVVDKLASKVPTGSARAVCVGVAGGTGSGKTTLVAALRRALGPDNVCHVCHDAYYKDISHLSLEERAAVNFDHPDSLDTDLMVQHVRDLKRGDAVYVPQYDFRSHSRVSGPGKASPGLLVHPTRVVLVEGILIFAHADLLKEMDIKIFVDTEADIRMLRRIQRDVIERGRTLESVVNQYLSTVKPMHQEFVEPSIRQADLIVPVGLNSVALDLLTTRLHRELQLGGDGDGEGEGEGNGQ